MSRKHLKSSVEVSERILKAARENSNWALMAKNNGVKYHTAYKWVTKNSAELQKRGGRRNVKIQDEHTDFLINCLSENCQLTLKELQAKLYNQFNLRVSHQAIAKTLDGRTITLKKVYLEAHNMNIDDNKRKRKLYVEKINELISENKTIFYVDESNVNLFAKRGYGRSILGTRASIKVASSKGPNIHMLGAISSIGTSFFEKRRGAYNHTDFNEWVKNLLRSAIQDGINMDSIVIVCDNAPCHSRIENLLEEEEFTGVTILRLAPYSFMLNPIENVWSAIKSKIKSISATDFHSMIAGDPDRMLTQVEWRLRCVENYIDQSIAVVNPSMCQRCINHCNKHFVNCIMLRDMEPGC